MAPAVVEWIKGISVAQRVLGDEYADATSLL